MREVPFADVDVEDEIDIPAFLLPSPDEEETEEAPGPAVALPPSGTGVRRHRRRQQRRDTRRRTLSYAIFGAAVIAVLFVFLAHPWRGGAPASHKPGAAPTGQAPLASSAVLV